MIMTNTGIPGERVLRWRPRSPTSSLPSGQPPALRPSTDVVTGLPPKICTQRSTTRLGASDAASFTVVALACSVFRRSTLLGSAMSNSQAALVRGDVDGRVGDHAWMSWRLISASPPWTRCLAPFHGEGEGEGAFNGHHFDLMIGWSETLRRGAVAY